ncbi:DUF4139 domain-containing protein [Nitrosovibrio sp. Nv17]|jgi:hypothetical protein|uniref:DUF4139 domain-containing protein n=1 Tax=Nitrosovibrio sp. Nv17 TaxID=1855339 RepID=UPI000908C5BE|nr:DUF4139 domain-containing protein [Nitrosovibrio sp. Nv17]SFW14005.1 hypothetical protein SAMN05216414_102109 [Nitrosovibrio sp. Nv17]
MLKTLRSSLAIAMLALFSCPGIAAPADPGGEVTATAAQQKAVAVTIYNDDLALVKDTRAIVLDREFNRLAWREVSARMRPETAQLRNLTHPEGFRLQEQNFDFDLLTPEKLLEKYLGKEVTVIRTNPATGGETRETATVLATQGGTILRFPDRIETGVPGRLAFPGVPENLRDRPTLIVSLVNASSGRQDLELSYLTGGLSWHADYVAELNGQDDRLDFNGWVTLTNLSGAAYPDARLQLVAGDLNRVRPPQPLPREVMAMAAKAADADEMRQESLFEYHLYTLQRPTTLAENQTKQVALLSAAHVPVRKELLLAGANYYYSGQYGDMGRKQKIGVYVEFLNRGEGLGVPLPKGIVRVYKKDAQGNAQFVGEDRIDHTPRNETVRLKLGDAFDVTADRKQTDFRRLGGEGRHDAIFETAYRLVIRNAKKEAVTVTVQEPVPGDWTMLTESHPHAKAASGIAEWKLAVPADGSSTLDYRVRVKHRAR